MENKNILKIFGKAVLMVWAFYTFVSPVDLIPDVFVGIGYIDDIIAILVAVKECYSTIHPIIAKITN